MFEKSFKLSILTMDKIALEEEVVSVVVPGSMGLFGILAGHTPLVGSLMKGKVKARYKDNRKEFISIDSGFIEVNQKGAVVILTDRAEMIPHPVT